MKYEFAQQLKEQRAHYQSQISELMEKVTTLTTHVTGNKKKNDSTSNVQNGSSRRSGHSDSSTQKNDLFQSIHRH